MIKKNPVMLYLLGILLFAVCTENMEAQDRSMAIGLKAGTTGFGAEFVTTLAPKLNARAGGSFFTYNTDGIHTDTDPSIRYDMSGSIISFSAVVDFYPQHRGLKLTAGLFYHNLSMDGEAVPNESYEVDGKFFEPGRLGSLSGKLGYKSRLAPYAGLGFGNPVSSGSPVTFSFEIGALYTGSPEFKMQGEGMIAPTAEQDRNLENGLSSFRFYPIINVGISYRFRQESH